MNDMPRNQVADDELDQVSGGKNFFDVFTTEFFEFFKDPKIRIILPKQQKEMTLAFPRWK